jgi:hypothetical protein
LLLFHCSGNLEYLVVYGCAVFLFRIFIAEMRKKLFDNSEKIQVAKNGLLKNFVLSL